MTRSDHFRIFSKQCLLYGYARFLAWWQILFCLVSLGGIGWGSYLLATTPLAHWTPAMLGLIACGMLLHVLIVASNKTYAILQDAGYLHLSEPPYVASSRYANSTRFQNVAYLSAKHRFALAQIYWYCRQASVPCNIVQSASGELRYLAQYSLRLRDCLHNQAGSDDRLRQLKLILLLQHDVPAQLKKMHDVFAPMQTIMSCNTRATLKQRQSLLEEISTMNLKDNFSIQILAHPHVHELKKVIERAKALGFIPDISLNVIEAIFVREAQLQAARATSVTKLPDIELLQGILEECFDPNKPSTNWNANAQVLFKIYRLSGDGNSRQQLRALLSLTRFISTNEKALKDSWYGTLTRTVGITTASNSLLSKEGVWEWFRTENRLFVPMAVLFAHLPAALTIKNYEKFKVLQPVKLTALAKVFSQVPPALAAWIQQTDIDDIIQRDPAQLVKIVVYGFPTRETRRRPPEADLLYRGKIGGKTGLEFFLQRDLQDTRRTSFEWSLSDGGGKVQTHQSKKDQGTAKRNRNLLAGLRQNKGENKEAENESRSSGSLTPR